MSTRAIASDFFVAGGTLHPDAPCYVKRPADDKLFNLALVGEYCYVLTTRQLGKSSLMIRTARRLQEQGISTAIIDLTSSGTDVTADQWYLSLLTQLKRRLRLSVDPVAWWKEHASLGALQRFTDFLHDVVLTEIEGPVVVLIDEIDTTLNLNFSSDDFFAAVRFAYNARPINVDYNRLTFVLLGVTTPAELIRDHGRTPFNIGQRVDLHEFSREDAQVLQQGLQFIFPAQGATIFARIYHWTNGHPYLTQRLCLAAAKAEAEDGDWTDDRVDDLAKRLFLAEEARTETNLRFVRDTVLNHPQRRQLLTLYRKVYVGKSVGTNERSVLQNRLKLSGLVKEGKDGYLHVRNQIYRRAFDLTWIRENMPINWASIVVAIALLIALGSILYSTIGSSICLPHQWCSQNSQRLKGRTVFALAGCSDGTLFAGAEDGIYRRTPGDAEWELEQPTIGEVRGLAASSDCTLVYAAALDQGVLRRETDSWSVVSTSDMIQARTVTLMGNMILAGGEFGLRFSVADRADFWPEPLTPFTGTVVNLVRSNGRLYAAVWDAGVWYCAKDDLDHWRRLNDGLDRAHVLHGLGSPTNGAPRFVGANDGLYRWNGTQWEKGPEQWGDTRTFWFVIDGATTYVGQENNGVLHSSDSGLTWEPINAGWDMPPFQVRTLLIHAGESKRRWLYAGTSEGVWRKRLPKPPTTLCNGDFERGLKCWRHGGELDQAVECDGDQCYAILGNPEYPCNGGVPVGGAWISQSLRVPQGISPTLSLKYRIFSYDLDLPVGDYFQVALNGEPLSQRYGNYEWNEPSCDRAPWDSGWQTLTLDLIAYRGEEIEISLHNVNGTQPYFNTWTYVGNIRVEEVQ